VSLRGLELPLAAPGVLRAHVRYSAIECLPIAHYAGVDRPEIEDVPQTAIDLARQRQWCLAGLFGRICLVESDHRGDVHDRVFGQTCHSGGREDVAGIVAKSVLDVITTASTVANRLLLYVSAEMTNTGRRFAGRDPVGTPRSAQ